MTNFLSGSYFKNAVRCTLLVKKIFAFVIIANLYSLSADAQEKFQPTWASLDKYKIPDWFRDAKFGIFIHWGVYSVPAFESEWYPRNMYRKESPEYKHANHELGVPMTNKITKAYLLADPAKSLLVNTKINKKSVIHLPAQIPDSINTVVVIEFEGEPSVTSSPMSGKSAVVSSEKSPSEGSKNLLDGDRGTSWVAAKGERKAFAEVDLKKPMAISSLVFDEPWHPWDNKKQNITLQYKAGAVWKTIVQSKSKGIGGVENFKPVTAQHFRLIVENENEEPALLEWQMYGPE
ncbi:MAG: alpha-L-fucosidase [Ginsengibacter sp.]